jgi:hypothetical protein
VNSRPPTQPQPTLVRLDPSTLERLAMRTAELLAERLKTSKPASQQLPEFLTAAQVSAWWGLTRRWIYLHSEELGAIPVGGSKRPRLRFEAEKVIQRLRRQPNRELS